jgi:hypothetical protein
MHTEVAFCNINIFRVCMHFENETHAAKHIISRFLNDICKYVHGKGTFCSRFRCPIILAGLHFFYLSLPCGVSFKFHLHCVCSIFIFKLYEMLYVFLYSLRVTLLILFPKKLTLIVIEKGVV